MATKPRMQNAVEKTARSAPAGGGLETSASTADALVEKMGTSAQNLLDGLVKELQARQGSPAPERKVPLFFPNGIGFVDFELSATANRTEGLRAVLKFSVAGVGEAHKMLELITSEEQEASARLSAGVGG